MESKRQSKEEVHFELQSYLQTSTENRIRKLRIQMGFWMENFRFCFHTVESTVRRFPQIKINWTIRSADRSEHDLRCWVITQTVDWSQWQPFIIKQTIENLNLRWTIVIAVVPAIWNSKSICEFTNVYMCVNGRINLVVELLNFSSDSGWSLLKNCICCFTEEL